jgi:hypothetical protein
MSQDRPSPKPLHRMDPDALHTRILDVLFRSAGTRMKEGVLLRAAQKIAAEILRSPISSRDTVHFSALAAMYGLGRLDDLISEQSILAVGRYLMSGSVIPPERLIELIRASRHAYLARCPCRASGRVDDRPRGWGGLSQDAMPPPGEALLQELLALWQDPSIQEQTAAPIAAALHQASRARARTSDPDADRRILAELQAALWPYWEILLEHPGYDPCWLEGLGANHKVWRLPSELLVAWVKALYASRGVIYTHMRAAGMPYAICSCPGPEADGGCLLTSWHYFFGNEEVLLPNCSEGSGQRRDESGQVLPCARYPERASRPCLGCGCEHPGSLPRAGR